MAHSCLHTFNILPSKFLALSEEDKDFLVASLMFKAEEEQKQLKDAKKKRGR